MLGAISFLNDAASDLVYPLVPLFVAQVLGAGPRALGIIEGVANATAALLKLCRVRCTTASRARRAGWSRATGCPRWRGRRSRSRRRPGRWARCAWPTGSARACARRRATRCWRARSTRRGAASRSACTGRWDHAGAVVGPLAAAALLAAGVGLREIFLWTAIPGAACVALALAIREPTGALAPPERIDWRLGTLPPRFRAYLAVVALFTLSQASNLFLLLRATQLGVPAASIPLLWAVQSGIAMLLTAPLSSLSDRLPRAWLLAGGWLLYAAVFGVLGASVDSPAGIAMLLALYGLVLAMTEGVEKALIADLVPPQRLGTAFGWFHLVAGLGLVPASAGFGWAWERFGAAAAFGASGAIAAVAAAAAVVVLGGARPR
jgi:hypothetical protein